MNNNQTRRLKAAILSIGTEVVAGDIVNSNAQWLSIQLTENQWDITCHLTIPDDHKAIKNGLDFITDKNDVIILTGGLGPTSDDFTRIALADWLKKELIFDHESWRKIERLFAERGQQPTENNRQQCFFPVDATILRNDAGTANAFTTIHNETKIICLPGPPDEIQTIWADHLKPVIEASQNSKRLQIRRWNCIGLSESVIAEMVDRILGPTGLSVGFRPHVPYVEVKLWLTEEQEKTFTTEIRSLNESLDPWLIYTNSDEPALDFLKHLSRFEDPIIFDSGTNGRFSQRILERRKQLEPPLQRALEFTIVTELQEIPEAMDLTEMGPDDDNLLLFIGDMQSDGTWEISAKLGNDYHSQTLQSPFPAHGRLKSRANAAMVELSCACFNSMLTSQLKASSIN